MTQTLPATIPPKKAVVFLLDRSGSMRSILDSTLESLNGYLEELRQDEAIELTLTQFDSFSTDTLHRRKPIATVKPVDKDVFVPRGGTPLVDAACLAIEWAKLDYEKTDKVCITILTDGKENSSTEFKMADLNALIKECMDWGWQFVFLGASFDNYTEGSKMGVNTISTVSYNASDRRQSGAALRASAAATMGWMAGQSANVGFSEELKKSVGDKYADKAKEGVGK